ncbi:MAG: hypothetical protein AAF756_11630 [Pseudomonadota bacterium]
MKNLSENERSGNLYANACSADSVVSGLRELSPTHALQVSGGFSVLEGFNWGVALGTVGGAMWTGSSVGATRYGIIGGMLGLSAGFGWGVGSVISMTLRGE